ncbi:MAG: succinyl-diaminopimelate desuccinylase [Alphaproteobacteria bacterium]|nr:MAG: succinyl-diaminopimelate desuccinylase [Alphaproteobacteria bacterium]
MTGGVQALDPIALAQVLIRCASVTPRDDGALAAIAAPLAALGFRCETMSFGKGPARVHNLYARLGSARPHFCFAGHSDVVPAGDAAGWAHTPFGGAVEDGWLKGRGAADMKGAIAAFIAAVADFLRAHGPPAGSISLLITGDEEGEAVNGTVKVLDVLAARGETIDACIVGEPTSQSALGDMIKIGRRGSLNATIAVHGTQGHVAYPERADNPIPRLLRFLAHVDAHKLDDGDADFQPSNLEITDIHVGNATVNLIPASATARLNIRFNTRHTGAGLKAWLEEAAMATAGRHSLDVRISGEAFRTAPGALTDLVVGAVRQVTGRTPALSTAGGTSDARFIARHAPVVECGLVGATMHKVDEQVAAADVVALARIYTAMLRRFFAPPAA